MEKQTNVPFFANLLDLPAVKSGVKAGTGAEFTYTANGNTAVLTDINYTPTPYPPPGGGEF